MTRTPKIITPEEKTDSLLGGMRNLLLNSEQTAGDVYLVEGLMPKGSEVPLHVHTKEDEIFHVLEGEVELMLGDETIHAKEGTIIYLPRNIQHGIKTLGEETARVLNYVIPGQNFENFFNEMKQLGKDVSPEKRSELASKYGISFL
ncbi:quercetin 2,3-dioxygenase [Kordia sp. SMS9]|uniref:cupin domain-containing protein n=1 Tax=Kordia sp. SMS9 TaxID=2282170 RepID=UPI000E0CC7C0|nr:cupin domain-containing protein [Kordia sp. SMS9]AXG72204.1 quercetin 2,3-dioxygenase [Kordia sp. SMS9]